MSDSEKECENQEEINIENRLDNYFNKIRKNKNVNTSIYLSTNFFLWCWYCIYCPFCI